MITITQKLIKQWLPDAVDAFLTKFPMPAPDIRIASRERQTKLRDQALVELSLRPEGNSAIDRNVMGEAIDSPHGSIILLFQTRCPAYYDRFLHLVWHEMGHVYAFIEEKEKFDPQYGLVISEEPYRTVYHFWTEFVAEALAFAVGNDIEQEPNILHPLVWTPLKARLTMLAKDGLNGDYSALGHFFAAVLTDRKTRAFMKAREESRLLVWANGGKTAPMQPGDVEPIEYTDAMRAIQLILEEQLQKPKWWIVDEETIEKLGEVEI